MAKATPLTNEPTVAPVKGFLDVENDLCEAAYLVEFLRTSMTRTLEEEHELTFSYGESRALVSLMQNLEDQIHRSVSGLIAIKEVSIHG
ncbi:hypothetical protein SAMN05216428_11285 [Nitrosospira sp. Nsp11]|uniref:hypothetical protein n=1 Tax=Nitrosospira sp. Nsp11 TaxID=1855338 RepID=UPI000917B97B|nr:hypothetical protein [Nitrosospira sp. Nsp11]SHM05339.1 hypothetical protein SAMN05216428_11285 [Nitrosospira sp. Nsp11]